MSRLEEIKEANGVINHKNPAWQEEIDWLINRVEELEDELLLVNTTWTHYKNQSERYKQILEQIANAGDNIDDLYYYQEKALRTLEESE